MRIALQCLATQHEEVENLMRQTRAVWTFCPFEKFMLYDIAYRSVKINVLALALSRNGIAFNLCVATQPKSEGITWRFDFDFVRCRYTDTCEESFRTGPSAEMDQVQCDLVEKYAPDGANLITKITRARCVAQYDHWEQQEERGKAHLLLKVVGAV